MRFMELPSLKPGYVWENVAPLGEKPEWIARPDIVQSDLLFGYREGDLLAKQYRTR